VACRTTRAKRDLVRIVRTPAGAVVVDATGRMSGRGAYLCADATCVDLARKKHALDRALNVSVPASVIADLAGRIPDSIMTEGGARGQE
jgi:predicted RNA-binding protein YlxR (DUF448 family)